MQKKLTFFYVLLLLAHCFVTFSASQEVYIPINLKILHNSSEKSSGFYTTVSKHKSHHHIQHDSQPNLRKYSAVELKQYFTGYTPKQILEQHALFMSDEFVTFAKTLHGYDATITALYKVFCKKSSIGKWWHSKWGKRIKKLYQELQEHKQVEQAAKQRQIEDQQRQFQSDNTYKQKLEIVARQFSSNNARAQALDVTRKNPSHRASRSISIDKAVIECAEQYGITKQDLTTGSMNAYEYQLHEEFVDQLAQLTYLADTYHMSKTENLLLDAIGEGVALGIEANKKYEPAIATHWADFGWEVLEVAKGIGEGVGLGAYNTVCFAKNVVCHPIRTTCEIAHGLGTIICAVGKAVVVPVYLGALCVTGNAEEAYKEAQEMYE